MLQHRFQIDSKEKRGPPFTMYQQTINLHEPNLSFKHFLAKSTKKNPNPTNLKLPGFPIFPLADTGK